MIDVAHRGCNNPRLKQSLIRNANELSKLRGAINNAGLMKVHL
jgi:hypothetical protein